PFAGGRSFHPDRRCPAGIRPDFFGTAVRIWPAFVNRSHPVTLPVAETTSFNGFSPAKNTIWNLGRAVGRLCPLPVPWQNARRAAFPGLCPTLPPISAKARAVIG